VVLLIIIRFSGVALPLFSCLRFGPASGDQLDEATPASRIVPTGSQIGSDRIFSPCRITFSYAARSIRPGHAIATRQFARARRLSARAEEEATVGRRETVSPAVGDRA
jgi:hypothetical protein